jgi:hypothetical protein
MSDRAISIAPVDNHTSYRDMSNDTIKLQILAPKIIRPAIFHSRNIDIIDMLQRMKAITPNNCILFIR